MKAIPVIDIFAGAGGLGEGFSSYSSPHLYFDVDLSIEMEACACDTLRMRAFFRHFKSGMVPELYYDAVRGDRYALERIKMTAAWKATEERVRNWTLGKTRPEIVHTAIRNVIGHYRDWVLLGGPPCQVYSVIGRAVRTGAGSNFSNEESRTQHRRKLEEAFAEDHRHTLYRRYLEIVAIHQPAIFIMENVTGILSARLPVGRGRGGGLQYDSVFEHIMADLRDPSKALRKDKSIAQLQKLSRKNSEVRYRLMSFTKPCGPAGECDDPADFLISCEKYGIPQTRRRMIILGVREDYDTRELQRISEWGHEAPAKVVLDGLPKIRSTLSADTKTRMKYGHDNEDRWYKAMRDSLTTKVLAGLDRKTKKTIKAVLNRRSAPLSRGAPFIEGETDLVRARPRLRNWIQDGRLGGAIQHEARAHMASDLGRYLYAAAVASVTGNSPKIEEWPKALLPAHRSVRASRNKKGVIVDGFNDRFRVQVRGRPASTVTSHISKDGHSIIHPDPAQCRSLTVREVARLQTFPDNYFFCGNRTEQYTQIGNAVPSLLAFQLAEVVAKLLEANGVASTSANKRSMNKTTRAPRRIKHFVRARSKTSRSARQGRI